MTLESFREYCLRKKGTDEALPFDDSTLVFRVMNKIFAITDLNQIELSFNLKCDPQRAIELRERYSCIKPGWHMNKKHWNTVEVNDSIDDFFLQELIDHSYNMVVKGLKKSEKSALDRM